VFFQFNFFASRTLRCTRVLSINYSNEQGGMWFS